MQIIVWYNEKETCLHAGLCFFYNEKDVTNETSWERKEEEEFCDGPDRNTP